MIRAALLTPLAALALAGCGGTTEGQAPAPAESLKPLPSAQPEPPVPAPEASASVAAADACGAGKLGTYLGKAASDDVLARIRAAGSPERVRVIRPGDAVTMDYREDRLNVEIGEDGKISRLRCG